ncbi:hypothetical protein [Bacteroides sp.]|uniref:hypothetical protein n=1 Tax=Bacteroides sp. TaxID=29523 RepID=UPI0040289132
MKLSKLFYLSALLVPLWSSCSKDSDFHDSPSGTGTRSEIQLVFNGSSDSEIYTRGIATESENEIRALRIYVFASDADAGTYYYQETFSTEADAADADHHITLQGTGISRQTSIKPAEWKTMPYLHLYCVANSELYTDGTTLATLTAISDGGDGTPSTDGATTETAFKAFVTTAVGNTVPINTPLAMKGSTSTKISGNYSKASVEMKRVVARFDIDNDASKTALTITKLSVQKAHPYATLFDTPVGTGTLQSYAPVDYSTLPNANAGISTGAAYMHPSAKANESLLVIEGTFLNPSTKTDVPVTYRVPIAVNPSTPVAGGGKVDYIDVKPNTRYTMHISEVTEAEITAIFEIEDWTSGGGVDIKPDNDVNPELLTVEGTPLKTAWNTGETHLSVTTDGDLTLTLKATGKVRAELAPIGSILTRAGGDWLTATAAYDPEYSEIGGQTQTTLKFTVQNIADAVVPVAVTLINEASSTDADLYTVLTVIPPAKAPAVSESATYTGSPYNTLDVTTPTAPTATLYKGTDSKLYFDVDCPFGSAVTTDKAAALKITKVATQGLIETYCLSFADVTTAETNATVSIANNDDPTQKTDITVAISDGSVVKANVTATEATYTAATDELEIAASPTGAVTLTVPSIAGMTLKQLDYSWFTVSHTTIWAGDGADTKKDVFTFTLKSGKTPVEIPLTFANAVKGGGDLIVKVTKAN